MNILGLNISRNSGGQQAPQSSLVKTNSYEESVAGQLTRRFKGSTASVNGRPIGEKYDATAMDEIYAGYIFAAIKKTRNRVANILEEHVETYLANDPKKTALDDARHPYLDVIDSSPIDNNYLYQGIATYLMLLGEAFLFTGERKMQAGNVVDVKSFELLQSNRVVRTWNDDGSLATYRLKWRDHKGQEQVKDYLPDNIIVIKDLNPFDLNKGFGMIRPIVDKVSLENMATKLQIATLANGIKAPGVLSTNEVLDDDEWDNFQSAVDTRWTSSDLEHQGTPITSNGGFIKYESMIEDLDKLAMKEIRSLNRDAFFAALSVSKTILGIEESGTTREVARVQNENFTIDGAMPICEAIVSALNQDFINNYASQWGKKRYKMRAIAPVEKDLDQEKTQAEIDKTKAETYKTLVEGGMSHESAAAVAGFDISDDVTLIFETKAAESAQSGAQGGNNSVTVHNHTHNHNDSETGETIADVAKNELARRERQKIDSAYKTLQLGVQALNTSLGESYLASTNAVSKDEQDEYINKLTGLLYDYCLIAVPVYGAARLLNLNIDFVKPKSTFNFNDAIREQIKQRLAKVANGHFSTINDSLSKIIADSVRDGESREMLARRVRDEVKNKVAGWEVERLVRTEAGNAYRQGQFFADKQFVQDNGYIGRAYKIWQTNSPVPCAHCAETAGKRVPLEDNFFNVGDTVEATEMTADGKVKQSYLPVRFVDVNAGGLHPNCRCDYRLEVE